MKRSQIKRRPFADSVLKTLEPEEKNYQEKDSPGLYLRVKSTGSKSWMVRYKRPNGKWAWKGIGGYPALSGKVAREEAQRLLGLVSDGVDLVTMGNETKVLFKDAAEHWYELKKKSGRGEGTVGQYRRYIDSDMIPVLGNKYLDEITRQDCSQVQRNLEDRGANETASKVRRWLNQIFSLAIAEGWTESNPASELKHVAVDRYEKRRHPHLLEPEIPDFLKALRQSKSKWVTLKLIRMVLRTACRPGMARFAEWSEIDLDKALWVIPAAKMKMRRDYVSPLATQTVEDLRAMKEHSGLYKYVFPGYGPKYPFMSENTINKALRMVGYKDKLVGHGARHTASTLLREHHWPKDFVEAQLDHVEDGMAGVYNQARYLDLRRTMVQWYANYLDALEYGTQKPKNPASDFIQYLEQTV